MGTVAGHTRRIVAIGGAALLALTAAGAVSAGDRPESSDARELVIARDMDLTTLDPSRVYCDTCQIFMTAVYETLITVNPADNSLEPRLAESWDVNDDSTVYTFTLRPDIVFADGAPLTSADVKWSWERLGGLAGSASYLVGGITSIDTPDDLTVVVTFESPNSAFLNVVAASYLAVVNSAVAIENGATADETDDAEGWFLENSAGSGPYVLESYSEGDELVLVRNDAYWGTAPVFPGVTLLQVQDSTSQLQQLQSGDVDIAMQINVDALGQLEGDESVTAELIDSYNFVYLALLAASPGGEALADPNVRQAIRMAIDYDGLLDITLGGNGNVQASPIPNGFEGSEGLPLPEYDADGATALLAEAGVDGVSITAAYPALNIYGVDFDTMMAKVQQDLSAVGIDLQLEPMEFAAWIERLVGEGIPITAVYFAPDHPDSSQYVQYFGMIDGGTWFAGAGVEPNATEADLFAEALSSSGEERTALYNQLGQAMIDDAVILPLVNPQLVLASASDITGMHYSSCCNLDLGRLGLG
jgi:peptide/nickel transport system substrate-binding protein